MNEKKKGGFGSAAPSLLYLREFYHPLELFTNLSAATCLSKAMAVERAAGPRRHVGPAPWPALPERVMVELRTRHAAER